MSKIQRYNGDFPPFARDFQSQERTSFGTEDVGVDNLTDNINSFWLRGWGIISPSEFPPIQYFNALGFTLSQSLAYLHQQGMPEWDAAQEYFIGSVTQKGGRVYIAQTGTDGSPNVGNDPTTNDGTNWAPMPNGKSARAEKATDSGADTFVSAVNTDVPAGDYTIRRDFQSANGTTAPTLDGKTVTTRDGSALWGGALSGVHGLQYKSGANAYRVLDPNPLEGDQPASVSYVDRKTGQTALVFATVGTGSNEGAVGDGVTDDVTAIANLAREISNAGGGILDGEGNSYAIGSGFDIADFAGVVVRNLTFDFTGVVTDSALFGQGGEFTGTVESLTVDAGNGDRSLGVGSTAAFAVGDWIMLERTQEFATGGFGNISELLRVRQIVDSNTIRVWGSIEYAYPTADNAKITKIVPVENIHFDRVTFLGNNSAQQDAMDIRWCRNVTARDCLADGWASRAFGFDGCWEVLIEHCKVQNGGDGTTNYGVAFTKGCHWCVARDCTFMDNRHGVTTGGGAWVNRYIKVINCTSIGARDAAFDSHRDCDHYLIDGCTCNALGENNPEGIIVQALRSTIVNNTVYGQGGLRHGIYVQWLFGAGAADRAQTTISNNEITSRHENAITVQNDAGSAGGPLVIANNRIKPQLGTMERGITVRADDGNIAYVSITGNAMNGVAVRGIEIETVAAGMVIARGTITGNQVDMDSTVNPAEGIRLNTADANSIDAFMISGNSVFRGNWGIRALGVENCAVVGNAVIGGASGVDVTGTNTLVANNLT